MCFYEKEAHYKGHPLYLQARTSTYFFHLFVFHQDNSTYISEAFPPGFEPNLFIAL